MNRKIPSLIALILMGLALPVLAEENPSVVDKSPSKDKIQWLGSETTLETTFQHDYVFAGKTDLGNNTHGDLTEREILIRQLITRRFFRAFLVRGGVEWERFDFIRAPEAMIPRNFHVLNAYLALDFRFSRKDMIRVQARPGVYTVYENPDLGDINYPVAIAYSRMVSREFQWALGLSINQWRERPYLAGGGFRWQMTPRWKLKMMLPEPMLEYKARDDLHVFAGGDFRGDTFRVSKEFGARRGRPDLDNALVDYQELRACLGFSWNIKPLIELNMTSGYVLDRAFHYHNNGLKLTSDPSPYITVSLQMLFEVWKKDTPEEPDLDTKGKQFEIPELERVLPNVPKIFSQ